MKFQLNRRKNQMQIMEESKSLDRKGRFINNKRIPLYVDVILSKALMSEKNHCFRRRNRAFRSAFRTEAVPDRRDDGDHRQ